MLISGAVLVIAALSIKGMSAGYIEVSNLELIRTVAVDKSDSGVTVTVSGSVKEGEKVRVSEKTAPSLASALNSLRRGAMEGEPFLAHTEHIIIGQEAAQDPDGIMPYLDYINRSTDMRLDTSVYIAKNSSAGDIIKSAAEKGDTVDDMLTFLKEDTDSTSTGHVFSCGDVLRSMTETGGALVQSVELRGGEDMTETIVPSGFAVMIDGVLSGYTSQPETKGICGIMETAEEETIDIPISGGQVTVGITELTPEVDGDIDGERIKSINIKISAKAAIEQVSGMVRISDGGIRESIEASIADIMESRTRLALLGMQNTGRDYMGILKDLELKHPYKFRKISSMEDSLRYAGINIEADVHIERSYVTTDPEQDGGW